MICIETSVPRDRRVAPIPCAAPNVTAACFGEPGVHQCPDSHSYRPLAAGLFGVGSNAAPLLLPRGVAGRA
jgi:hypothetical protein